MKWQRAWCKAIRIFSSSVWIESRSNSVNLCFVGNRSFNSANIPRSSSIAFSVLFPAHKLSMIAVAVA